MSYRFERATVTEIHDTVIKMITPECFVFFVQVDVPGEKKKKWCQVDITGEYTSLEIGKKPKCVINRYVEHNYGHTTNRLALLVLTGKTPEEWFDIAIKNKAEWEDCKAESFRYH